MDNRWTRKHPEFYISRCNFIKKNLVCCYDYNGTIRISKTLPIWKNNLEVDKRGINVGFSLI
jgi:hypothetical protein